MKCVLCKCPLSEKNGTYEFDSAIAGKIFIPDINYLECQTCHEKLIQPNEHNKIIKFVSAKEVELIARQPIGSFFSAKEAAKILGMSKQAFSKHSRIKRGFILSIQIDQRRYYLKDSVNLFKANNCDGRFSLIGKTLPHDELHKEKGNLFKYSTIFSRIIPEFETERYYVGNYYKIGKQNLSTTEYTKEKEYYVKKNEV